MLIIGNGGDGDGDAGSLTQRYLYINYLFANVEDKRSSYVIALLNRRKKVADERRREREKEAASAKEKPREREGDRLTG